MSIILDTIEKINTKWNQKGYVVKRTHHERPRFLLAAIAYIVGYVAVFGFLTEFTNVFAVILAPLRPIILSYTEPDMTLVGWILVIGLFGVLLVAFIAGAIPAFICVDKYSQLLDKEWPDSPEKTKEWRDNYAKRKNKTT